MKSSNAPGRANRAERSLAIAGEEPVHGIEAGARREHGRVPGCRHNGRISIEVASTGGAEPLEGVEEADGVHGDELVPCRRSRLDRAHGIGKVTATRSIEDGTQARRSLGMPPARVVVEESRRRAEQDRQGSHATRY